MDDARDVEEGLSLELLFEELDDEDFDFEFEEAVEEICDNAVGGDFSCLSCTKTYKTKSGLKRHVLKKHTEDKQHEILNLSLCDLETMINGVLTELFKDENYPIFIRQEIVQTKTDPVLIQSLLEDLNPLLLELKETSNPDTFFGKHYGFIMYNSAKYFSSLRPQFSALILKRLGDKLLQRIKGKQYTDSATEKQQMTEEEMDALSYLAGYVVKKFIIKLSNKKQEDVLNGLRNMVDLTNTENQGLIAAVNRGGLTIVSKDTLKIFKKAEELFREN